MQAIAAALRADKDQLAIDAINRAFAADAQLWRRYGVNGRQKCIADTAYHLEFVAEASSSAGLKS
jgi:hypothetical protein